MTTPPFTPPAIRPSSALPDMLWLAQADVISVPLQTISQRPFVQVVLNGHPALFLFDTSILQTSVDAAALSDAARSEPAQSLQIGELRFLRVPSIRNGVRAYAQTYFGVSADGVIGADLLARFPVAIDYKAGSFSIFHTTQAATAARPAQSLVVALASAANVPVVAVSMNGQAAGVFGIDTGSGMDFEVRPFTLTAKHITMVGTLPELRETRVSGSMHGKTMRAREAAIGEVQIAAPLVAVPDERQRWLPPNVDGMLGARLLEKMNLLIDFPGHNLVISQTQANPPSIYDRSGAWLILRSGALVVHDILRGSPADVAGLSIGDEILKINSETTSNLEAVRAAFMQTPGTRVGVAYRRARRNHTATLVLRNLL